VSATGEEDVRDHHGAMTLAKRAVGLAPTHAHFTTLGVAYYRLGRLADAVEALHTGIAADRGRATAADLFVLAMCYHHQGQAEKARDAYRRAVVWTAQHRPEDDELRRFRAEASSLLRP
jgi:Tfp pilus assembly protein PilF